MKFINENKNLDRFVDGIFTVQALAINDPLGLNATVGCLKDEEEKLFTYQSVFEAEKNLPIIFKAAYAKGPEGNKDYLEEIEKYILEDRVKNHYRSLATIGGTGAIYTSMNMCLKENDYIIYPKTAWGNYKVMANEFGFKSLTYDPYDLDEMFRMIDIVDNKVFIIINSPCQNPTGLAYSYETWQKIINKLNNLNKEVVLLVDISYIDYAYGDYKDFFNLFNEINDNVLVLIASSTSKSFSFYGERLGALILIHNDEELLDHFVNLASRLTRATFSTANNGAMNTIADVLKNHKEEYLNELALAKKMLKKRADLFIKEAKENDLSIYEYSNGFFVTLKFFDNETRDKIHQNLIDHHIYTVKVEKGIRIGICAIPLNKLEGLAFKIKECY